jgi:hypothetical protein
VNLHEFRLLGALSVAVGYVVVEDLLKLLDDVVATEGGVQLAIHVDRGFGVFEGSGEADAEIRVF